MSAPISTNRFENLRGGVSVEVRTENASDTLAYVDWNRPGCYELDLFDPSTGSRRHHTRKTPAGAAAVLNRHLGAMGFLPADLEAVLDEPELDRVRRQAIYESRPGE